MFNTAKFLQDSQSRFDSLADAEFTGKLELLIKVQDGTPQRGIRTSRQCRVFAQPAMDLIPIARTFAIMQKQLGSGKVFGELAITYTFFQGDIVDISTAITENC